MARDCEYNRRETMKKNLEKGKIASNFARAH
jgi:hypothetical protein